MFEEYLIKQISEFLYEKRKEAGLTQLELAMNFIDDSVYDSKNYVGAENTRSDISRIENGRPAKENKSYITKKMLEYYSTTFEITKDKIIFGNDDQIEEFCKHIFMECAYDRFDYEDTLIMKYFDVLKSINSKIIQLLISNAEFANFYIELSYNNHFQLKDTKLKDLVANNIFLFKATTEKIWNLTKEYFIDLFCEQFLGQDVVMYKLNSQILNWLENIVLIELDTIYKKLKQDEFYGLGYEVYEINTLLYNLRDGKLPIIGSFILSDIDKIDNEAFFDDKYKIYKNLSVKLTNLQNNYLNNKSN